MRKFANIIESTTPPPTNCLWIKGKDALYFSNGKWQSLLEHDSDEDRKELETKVDDLDKEVGQIKRELSIFGSEQGVIELEIGDSNDVKTNNLKKLQSIQTNDHTFFTDINYGYGTASWLPTTGGNAFIITDEGHSVKYKISSDGAVTKLEESTIETNATATKDTPGTIKAITNIVDLDTSTATTGQIAGVINNLLKQFRTCGLIVL